MRAIRRKSLALIGMVACNGRRIGQYFHTVRTARPIGGRGRLMTMQQALICKGCWQQMHVPVPLRGVLSVPFRAVGIRPSRMNPNTCTICEMMFTTVMRARKVTIDATVMFADLRGYTALSQSLSVFSLSRVPAP